MLQLVIWAQLHSHKSDHWKLYLLFQALVFSLPPHLHLKLSRCPCFTHPPTPFLCPSVLPRNTRCCHNAPMHDGPLCTLSDLPYLRQIFKALFLHISCEGKIRLYFIFISRSKKLLFVKWEHFTSLEMYFAQFFIKTIYVHAHCVFFPHAFIKWILWSRNVTFVLLKEKTTFLGILLMVIFPQYLKVCR